MALMEISVVPIGTCSTSISKYVASSEKALKKDSAIKRQITAMGTILEAGSVAKLFSVAKKMHRKALAAGAMRVITSIVLDDRRDKKGSIKSKLASGCP
ncbi:MAG: MTH1187 family thiamine-binding protein [Candidatus Omnitrophica bacterium]|nr:MTH1187 family thiamine-binding protein [Candidatus Omnitrophota bacterium]